MKTVKILKNVSVTLANCHDNIHIGQSFNAYYTSVDKSLTVVKIHKQLQPDIYDRRYLVDAIEQNN
mgnify:CR=1 FL=1